MKYQYGTYSMIIELIITIQQVYQVIIVIGLQLLLIMMLKLPMEKELMLGKNHLLVEVMVLVVIMVIIVHLLLLKPDTIKLKLGVHQVVIQHIIMTALVQQY